MSRKNTRKDRNRRSGDRSGERKILRGIWRISLRILGREKESGKWGKPPHSPTTSPDPTKTGVVDSEGKGGRGVDN